MASNSRGIWLWNALRLSFCWCGWGLLSAPKEARQYEHLVLSRTPRSHGNQMSSWEQSLNPHLQAPMSIQHTSVTSHSCRPINFVREFRRFDLWYFLQLLCYSSFNFGGAPVNLLWRCGQGTPSCMAFRLAYVEETTKFSTIVLYRHPISVAMVMLLFFKQFSLTYPTVYPLTMAK